MKYYDVVVEETRHYTVRYRVMADDENCARLAAEDGVSESETELEFHGVINRTVAAESPITEIPAHVAVEYDLNYRGGDYHGYGQTAFLLMDGLTEENLPERFQLLTGHDPIHIIHYSFDEPVDASGEPLEGD